MSIWSSKTTLVIAAALLIVPAGYAASAPHRRAGCSARRDCVVGRLPRSACKGARLRLKLGGRARRAGRAR